MYNDLNDEFLLTENAAAALNWSDEPHKDKIFSMRNFACDANIYINIKEVLTNGTDDTQKKVATFVKRISLLKQKVSSPQRTASPTVHVIQKPIVPAPAAVPVLARSTAAAKASIDNGIGHGQVTQKSSANARQQQSMQTPVQMQALKNALTRHNIPANMVGTPNASSPIASVQNASNAPYTTVSLHALHAINMAPQSPLVACAPHALPLANNMQPIAYAPNVPNASNVPHLLDLPQSVRLRNRAYSIHFAPNEQIPGHITARRKSFGNDLLTPSHAIQSVAAAAAADQDGFDHTYTRSTMSNSLNYYQQNGQRASVGVGPFITKIHAQDIAAKNSPTPTPTPAPVLMTTLKVLTPDDLNSRM